MTIQEVLNDSLKLLETGERIIIQTDSIEDLRTVINEGYQVRKRWSVYRWFKGITVYEIYK